MVGRGGVRRKPGRRPTAEVCALAATPGRKRAGAPTAARRRAAVGAAARTAPARHRRVCTLPASFFGRPVIAFCHSASGTLTATSVWLGSTVTAGESATSLPPRSL